jgi:hypothetical protein
VRCCGLTHELGLSVRQVREATGVGKTAVREYVNRARVVGITWPGMDGKANSSYSGPRGQVRFAAPSGPEEQGYLWSSGGLS